MIRRVDNSPSFSGKVVRDNVLQKGIEFTEKYGTNLEKRTLKKVIEFFENDGTNSVYRVKEGAKNYPMTDYVLLKDENIVKTVGAYVNPEYNIIATLIRYAQDLGAKF